MSGLSSSGAVTQMTAQGLADAVLTGNPQVTFWRFVAKAYTNFALETQLLDFTAGVPNFGAFPKCNLDRIGDLVYWMYVVFDLPGIGAITYGTGGAPNTIATGEYRPFWTRAIGQALIESANFFIGGQNIDYMKGEFLFIWEELTGQPGKRLIEMTGNYRTLAALQTARARARSCRGLGCVAGACCQALERERIMQRAQQYARQCSIQIAQALAAASESKPPKRERGGTRGDPWVPVSTREYPCACGLLPVKSSRGYP